MSHYFGSPYAQWAVFALAADGACFGASAAFAWLVVRPPINEFEYLGAALLLGFLGLVALTYCDAYRPAVLGSGRRTVYAIALSMSLAFVVALTVYFLIPLPGGAIESMAHTALIFFPLLVAERAAFRFIAARHVQRVLILGTSHLAVAIAQLLRKRPGVGVELVGFISDRDDLQGDLIEGKPALGRTTDLDKLVERLQIHRIIVASKDRNEHFPAEELLAAKLRGMRVDCGIAFYEDACRRFYLPDLRSSYLIFSDGFRQGAASNVAKRGLDILMAAVALILAAPFLPLVVLAIRLDSPGPALFRQERVGKDGETFEVLKLRTMMEDAEEDGEVMLASTGDERITRVGRILRMIRFDEVPQFINVLRNEMSVVGPRPERPTLVETLTQEYPLFRTRTAVKPGITGWAQIRYGYVNDLEAFGHKLSLDLFYLKNRSLALDLLIVWETIKTVVTFRGL